MSLPLHPEVQVLVHIRPVFKEFAHNFVPGPGCGLDARFYQAEPAPVVGTTKCPESLCLMSALPSSGRRVPPPPRTLLLVHRSYRLMRQSRVALLYFGFWPRSWSLRRLLPAPAATGILPTLSLRILPQMPKPMPRRFAECVCLVLPSIHRPSPSFDWVGFPLPSVNTTFHGSAFEAAAISLCSGLRVCSPPRSFLPLQVSPQGSRGFLHPAERASLPSHASDMLSARLQAIGGTRTFISQDSVAVGMPIARHPPHRPVLALLAHTVPTLDAGRRSAR